MVEVEVLRRIIGNKSKAHDTDNVNEVNGKDACRQVPPFGFPVSGISNHKNGKQEHQRYAIAGPADPYAIRAVDAEHLEIVYFFAGKSMKAKQV